MAASLKQKLVGVSGFSRGRRKDFVVCNVDLWGFGRWTCRRAANFLQQKRYIAGIILRGSYRSSHAAAQLFRGKPSIEASAGKSLKRIVLLRSSVWSTCHSWRKSRQKKPSFFELQSFIFEVNYLAEKLRFWASKLHFLKLKPTESQIEWLANQLNLKANESQTNWISKQLNLKSSESHITWIPTHLLEFQTAWAFEPQISDGQITWNSNQLTTKSLDSQINRQPNHLNLQSKQSNLKWATTKKTLESQIRGVSKQLNLKFVESQTKRDAKQLNLKWIDFNQLKPTHPLLIGSLWLETSTASCGRYVIQYYNRWVLRTSVELPAYAAGWITTDLGWNITRHWGTSCHFTWVLCLSLSLVIYVWHQYIPWHVLWLQP